MPQNPTFSRSLLTHAARLGLMASLALPLAGCFVFKPQLDELQAEVDELEKKVSSRDKELEETLSKAERQSGELEDILRKNQANLGVRVDNMETDVQETRGVADDTLNETSALKSNIEELRAFMEERITELEGKVNQATDIPEGKQELLAAAERQLKKEKYKESRRLFRTYLSRYPADKKAAEVRFKIGLTLYSERDYRSALGEFYWIVQNAPKESVIHDALYYSGLAFAKLGQCDKATAYFNELSKKGSKAPDRYQSRAKEQIEALGKDDGKICTDRAADGGKTGRDAT